MSNKKGQSLNDEAIIELQKMLLRIGDFTQVYNVSENKFTHKSEPLNVRICIQEVSDLMVVDCKARNIDLSS